jgi:predicted transcriptional regulator
MFSCRQQKFILELLFRKTIFKKNQTYYKSNIAFYRTISYLRVANMMKAEKKESFNEYSLTERGKLFAVWLSALPDNKFIVEELEKRFGQSMDREIARQIF